jgi:hypothetical protein
MKDDLLILKLLKMPVTLIKFLSKFISMMTYIANYILILALDSVIFSPTLLSSLLLYALSWPLRLAALMAVIAIFCGEFYLTYRALDVSHLHWGVQLIVCIVVFQGVLALMSHGYKTMIARYSPTKLKSLK